MTYRDGGNGIKVRRQKTAEWKKRVALVQEWSLGVSVETRGRKNKPKEEKRKDRREETDRTAVMTEALKAEGEKKETDRQWKRQSKLTAACH